MADAGAIKREAVVLARLVAEAYPEDALTYALLGSAYYNTGQSEEATRQLRRCLELSPHQAEAYAILALIAYEKGELEETVRLCQEALKNGPPGAEVLNRLGRAQMDLGQAEAAIPTLRRAADLPKPVSESAYLLGQAYLQSGDPAAAKESFLRATTLLPDHTQGFFGLYTACLRLGQTNESARYREQFQKLEAIDRKTLSDQGAQEEGLTGINQVRTTVARTFFGAAQLHQSHGQSAKASELFIKCAVLDPDSLTYRSALESVHVQSKAPADGIAAFEQLIRQEPDNGLNYYFLARFHSRLEHPEAAERCYQRVGELIPDWPESYRALADLYLRTGRKLPQAKQLALRVVEMDPTASHFFLLAVACMRNGDRPGALDAGGRAASLSPGETKYRQFLERLNQTPQTAK